MAEGIFWSALLFGFRLGMLHTRLNTVDPAHLDKTKSTDPDRAYTYGVNGLALHTTRSPDAFARSRRVPTADSQGFSIDLC